MRSFRLPLLGACFLALSPLAHAQVVVSEIHYHPVEEPAFNADGTPVLDLSGDVHEFVEIQNAGLTPVDLSGWTLAGGVSYTFPAGTTLAAGGFQTIARTPARITTVYGLSTAVLGPYSGRLGNNGDTVRVRDAAGNTVDSVTYSASFPWPVSADALGAQDDFLGLTAITYQYKGRSLQRVSVAGNSNDPANWLASSLASGPTPNGPQAVTRAVPKPVVTTKSAVQTADGATIIRSTSTVTVAVSFSSTANLSNVQVEYFVDAINSTTETRSTAAMTSLGNGKYSVVLPAQADRSVVRWRVRADRGDGLEVVSPRADDPQIAPVGASGAREAWHAYFVMPTGRSTAAPNYDLFVSSASLTQLNTNIVQNPKRVTAASATGVPREVPFVAATAPQWNGTQPAVFVDATGTVHDVQFRHHGSFAHRAASQKVYKIGFPKFRTYTNAVSENAKAIFITADNFSVTEGSAIFRAAGFPVSRTQTVSWYFNTDAVITRTEQGDYSGDMLDAFHELQQRLNPGSELEETGELYKNQGNISSSGNNTEGPYTAGDHAPLVANAGWSVLGRFQWMWVLENHDWKGHVPMRSICDAFWIARGDSPSAPNLNVANTRAHFQANYDLDRFITSMAMVNWMGAWDDTVHNHFFWRRADGRWTLLPWDLDDLMVSSRTSQTIYPGEVGTPNVFFGPSYLKDAIYKAFRAEYNQRLWELNNSLFDPANLSAMGFPNAATFANARRTYVNNQLAALGTYYKPARPTNASPAAGAAVIGNASLTTSAYSNPNPTPTAHSSTKWEIRVLGGTYEDPVLRVTTTGTNLTSFPIPFSDLTYGKTYYWRATHLGADGHPSVVSAETAFSYGTASTTAGTLVLNEILADNRTIVQNGSSFPDYIELRNNGATTYDLSGLSLTDDATVPAKFVFPAGTTLAAGERLLVWCDSDASAPGLHTGFGLNSEEGETVLLLNGATILDSIAFGPQAPDISIGRVLDGTGGWAANRPTPGAANLAATLGSVTTLKVNEWMASPASGEDWFELYNPDANPVALADLYLSDTPATPLITRVPALSFIGGKGYAKFIADGTTAGGNHCNFKLSASGENLVLTAANGATTIDTVTFGAQASNVSQGRLPDGAASPYVSFTGTPSPGRSNYAQAPVVINELMASAVAPFEPAVELYNASASAVDISGWWLSNDPAALQKYQIPAGTTLPAGGYRVIYANALSAGAVPFLPSALGGNFYLAAVDGTAALTGYRSQVSYGTSLPNTSFGRIVVTGGLEFWPLTARTFGNDTPLTVADFRLGTGGANAAPVTTPVILNEVMYHPPDVAGADDPLSEYVELHNPTTSPVDLTGWQLQGDTSFTFASGTTLRPGDYILVVNFDPATNAAALSAFRTKYSLTASTRIYGPYVAKLSNSSQKIELMRPNLSVGTLMVDRIEYADASPWPTQADGGGRSLQRTSRTVIGNNAANWTASLPTPGAVNVGQTAIADSDGDGIPDAYEIANGLDPYDAGDAALDSDGDGLTNLQEYLAGTDPRSAMSYYHADVAPIAGGFRVSFAARAGGHYVIQYSTDLVTWTQLLNTTPATVQTVQYDDLTTDPKRLYRVISSNP